MTTKDLVDIVSAACVMRNDKKVLPCEAAFELARQHGVELLDIARICNRKGIKVVQCQLGCFK